MPNKISKSISERRVYRLNKKCCIIKLVEYVSGILHSVCFNVKNARLVI